MAPHILIVDDDLSIRDAMHEFIVMSGYESSVASSAEEALDVLTDNSVEVVITDIMLPGMDGLALTDQIKSSRNIDVIVMTGYSTDYSYEEAISKGASDFVFKPVRFEELLLRLKRVLKERRLNQERVQMLDELKKLSITDGLTQLYNSRYFYNQLKGEIERCNRYGHKLGLLLLDNFEHLLGDPSAEGVSLLVSMLSNAPDLKIMVSLPLVALVKPKPISIPRTSILSSLNLLEDPQVKMHLINL